MNELKTDKPEMTQVQPAVAAMDGIAVVPVEPNVTLPPPQALALNASKKTTGEYAYDVFQFLTGKVFIIVITAALAFMADPKHGKDTYLGVPNYLKKLSNWLVKKTAPLKSHGKAGEVLNAAIYSTVILSHGGNFFAPFIKWLENGRENISNFFNRTIGKPGEEEIAHERLKDIPKQNWWDIIKGRLMAYGTVFSVFISAEAVLGKDKKLNKSRFAIYEDWFARKVAWFSKEGKAIAATPVTKELTEIQKANTFYRFGKVAALDLYATTMAIIVWNWASRFSAKKRVGREAAKNTPVETTTAVAATPVAIPTELAQEDSTQKYVDKIDPQDRPAKSVKQKTPDMSYADMVDTQRQSAEQGTAQAVAL